MCSLILITKGGQTIYTLCVKMGGELLRFFLKGIMKVHMTLA